MIRTNLKGSNVPIRIETNMPQYWFDDSMIAHHARVTRKWMQPSLFPYPALVPDQAWEGRVLCLFGTVLPHPDDGFRLYYSNYCRHTQSVLLATGKDGINWRKPNLGLVDWEGSTNNNIVHSSRRTMDSPSLMYDPEDAAFPYKMIACEMEPAREPQAGLSIALYGYGSADGLHWTRWTDDPVLKAGDRTNIMPEKQQGKYVIYTRAPDMLTTSGKRCIYRSESANFMEWTEPELVFEPDLYDRADVEFYGMSVFARNGWHFGLLEYWHSDEDRLEIHLAYSRDGKTWSRPEPRIPFIASQYDWNRKWNSCASNGPLIIGTKMVFHVGGRWSGHGVPPTDAYGAIGFATLPVDRFCALEAQSEGQVITVPIRWPGGKLLLNADTRESFHSHPVYVNGEISVDILDVDGHPIAGRSGEHAGVYRENSHGWREERSGEVKWRDGTSLNDLIDQDVRLKFRMRHARLFTFTIAQ